MYNIIEIKRKVAIFMATRKQLREETKKHYMEKFIDFLDKSGEDVLIVGSNKLAFPVTDSENNEDFIELTIKIPIGANKGTEPYDGYAMAEDYEIHRREMAEKKEKAKKFKEEKIKRDKLYRENKKRQKEGRAV